MFLPFGTVALGWAPGLPTNVGLGCKQLTVAEILAFYAKEFKTQVKRVHTTNFHFFVNDDPGSKIVFIPDSQVSCLSTRLVACTIRVS